MEYEEPRAVGRFARKDPKPKDELRLEVVGKLGCVGVETGEDDSLKPRSASNGENISLARERSGVTCLQKVAIFNIGSGLNVNVRS